MELKAKMLTKDSTQDLLKTLRPLLRAALCIDSTQEELETIMTMSRAVTFSRPPMFLKSIGSSMTRLSSISMTSLESSNSLTNTLKTYRDPSMASSKLGLLL